MDAETIHDSLIVLLALPIVFAPFILALLERQNKDVPK